MRKQGFLTSRSLIAAGAVLGFLGLAMPASAQERVSWDFLSGSLMVDGDIEDIDLDQGYRLEGAASLGEYVFFRTRIDNHDVDQDPGPIVIDTQEWGIGGHYPVDLGGVSMSPWGALSYERLSAEGAVLDGWSLNLGIRALFLNGDLEAGLGYKMAEVENDDMDAEIDIDALELSVAYRVVNNVDAMLNINNITLEDPDTGDSVDFDNVISLGARFRF